jgi:hypothetical protein
MPLLSLRGSSVSGMYVCKAVIFYGIVFLMAVFIYNLEIPASNHYTTTKTLGLQPQNVTSISTKSFKMQSEKMILNAIRIKLKHNGIIVVRKRGWTQEAHQSFYYRTVFLLFMHSFYSSLNCFMRHSFNMRIRQFLGPQPRHNND